MVAQIGSKQIPMEKIRKSDEEWQEELPPEVYDIVRLKGTEAPFTGELLHNKDDGTYRCVACGLELFSSDSKFDSGSGWPSFDEVLAGGNVEEHTDSSHGMSRTEVTCARCGAHLGHLFPDGPTSSGMRYCINSKSLKFEKEGK